MEKIKIFILVGIVLLILFLSFAGEVNKTKVEDSEEVEKKMGEFEMSKETTLIVVYDNYEHDPELRTGWGFSCLVQLKDKNILFDTGGDSLTLLSNMEKLGIGPQSVDTVVLSHIHGDHVGGLSGLLKLNPDIMVYTLKSFPSNFKEEIKSYGADYVDVTSPIKVFDGVYTTGELGIWIKEQSLIVKTEKGIVVITGCAHPGIVNIVKEAKEITKDKIYLVIGGFHLSGTSDADLIQIINAFREFGVEKAGPCHCSGDRCRELFEQEYGDDFVEVGVGKIIKI